MTPSPSSSRQHARGGPHHGGAGEASVPAGADQVYTVAARTVSTHNIPRYYTSLFLGALAIVCIFGFLFLVPFVLDPAISTMMHQFVTNPVHCRVSPETITQF